MFLILISLCSFVSSADETCAVICESTTVNDCVLTSDEKEGLGITDTGILSLSGSTDFAGNSIIGSVNKVVFLLKAGTADKTFTVNTLFPETVRSVYVVSKVTFNVVLSFTAPISVDSLTIQNTKLSCTKKIETTSLTLNTKGTFTHEDVIFKSGTTPTITTSIALDSPKSLMLDKTSVTLNDQQINAIDLKIKLTITDVTNSLKIDVKADPGAIVANTKIELSIATKPTTNTAQIEITDRVASFVLPELTFITAERTTITVQPPATPKKLTYTVKNAEGTKLFEEFPYTKPIAICIKSSGDCSSSSSYINNDSLYKLFKPGDVAAVGDKFKGVTSFTFVLGETISQANEIDLKKYMKSTNSIKIISDTTALVGLFKIPTTASAKMLETEPTCDLLSLSIDTAVVTISGINAAAKINIKTLYLKGIGATISAENLVVNDTVTIDKTNVGGLKKVTLLNDLIVDIKNPTSGKSLTFNDNGWDYDLIANVIFSSTTIVKPFGKTVFNIEYEETTSITVKAKQDATLLPLLIKTFYKSASTSNLLASDDTKLTITIDKESWSEADAPEDSAKEILIVDANDKERIDIIGKDDMGKYTLGFKVNGKPSNIDGPQTSPTPKGLSAGAIAGIVVGCIAAVTGICVGVFFYLKKSKAKVTGADP